MTEGCRIEAVDTQKIKSCKGLRVAECESGEGQF